MEACKQGNFCLYETSYQTGLSGIEVGKILKVSDKNFEVDNQGTKWPVYHLTLELWAPIAPQKSHEPMCLNGKWGKQPNPKTGKKGSNIGTEKNWSVLAYFDKFNSGDKLPKAVRDAVPEALWERNLSVLQASQVTNK